MTEEYTATYCYIHPDRETSLRCNRCNRYICSSCAVRVPTGYTCRNCIREHQRKFENAVWYDYIIGFFAAAMLSAIAAFLVTLISGFFYGLAVLFAAPAAGTIIARILLAVLRRHRSRALFLTISGGMIAGAIPALLSQVTRLLFNISQAGMQAFSIWQLLPTIWIVVYLFIAVPMVYAQYSGIQLSK
jgi:ABC-type Fe3+-siderophore transport system permease subunit